LKFIQLRASVVEDSGWNEREMKMMSKSSTHQAFTLIELLIVVLIIAILAAIAIPNFMEFQTRAKVSRVKNDQRMVATAMEAYCVDEGTYVGSRFSWTPPSTYRGYNALTSPIAYMTTIPTDPFGVSKVLSGEAYLACYELGSGKEGHHCSYSSGAGTDIWRDRYPNDCWLLSSVGPDGWHDGYSAPGVWDSVFYSTGYPWLYATMAHTEELMGHIYDPTNGTNSFGQINRVGGVGISRPPVNIYIQAISK
jgi:type II secretion system protein G